MYFKTLPEIRRFYKSEQEESILLINLGCNVSCVQDHINTKTDKRTIRKDYNNLIAKERNPNEQEIDESLKI